MEGHEIFLLIAIIAGLGFMAKKMAKSILTVSAITVLVCFLYLILSGEANFLFNPGVNNVFEKNDVFHLHDTYCCNSCVEREQAMCDCFIQPVYYGVLDNIPHGEVEYYNENRDLLRPITRKVLREKQASIDHCLDHNKTNRFGIIQDIENMIKFYKQSREMRRGEPVNLKV